MTRRSALALIERIADRAVNICALYGVRANRGTILMDLVACHFRAQKLRLNDLLVAADFHLMHDVAGIRRHLNRADHTLGNCFSPCFAVAS